MIGIAQIIFDTVGGRALVIGAGVAGLFIWWQVDRAGQRDVGRKEVKAAVGANNADVQNKASNAGRRSLDPGARGVLNPYYRAD